MGQHLHETFIAIDFETYSPLRTSACAIGAVKVVNGKVQQKIYSLLKPIPDDRTQRFTHIHGITDDMIVDAPTFEEYFPILKHFIGNHLIVCHNASMDISVLNQCMDYYQLSGIDTNYYQDTYRIFGRKLDVCCDKYNIILDKHHDALADAEACAGLYLCHLGIDPNAPTQTLDESPQAFFATGGNRKIDSNRRRLLSEQEITNKGSLFYHQKIIITGTFSHFPKRDDLAIELQKLGAKINSSVSRCTNIIVVGNNAGPAKLKKVETINSEKETIKVMHENELINELKKHFII